MATAPTPWVLADSTWETVRQAKYQVAVLPWGATEAHNRHLPYATDTIQAESVARLAAERAWAAGARVGTSSSANRLENDRKRIMNADSLAPHMGRYSIILSAGICHVFRGF